MQSKLILELPMHPLFLHILNFGEHSCANLLIFFLGLWKLSLHINFIFSEIVACIITKALIQEWR